MSTYSNGMGQNYLTLYDLNILNRAKEDDTHLLKPAQFASLTKHIAMIPRDFSSPRDQLKFRGQVSLTLPVFLLRSLQLSKLYQNSLIMMLYDVLVVKPAFAENLILIYCVFCPSLSSLDSNYSCWWYLFCLFIIVISCST